MQNTLTKEFTFYIDQKTELWTRSTKHISAETEEEAEQIIRQEIENGTIYENLDEYQFLYETQRDLDIIEILNEKGKIIN